MFQNIVKKETTHVKGMFWVYVFVDIVYLFIVCCIFHISRIVSFNCSVFMVWAVIVTQRWIMLTKTGLYCLVFMYYELGLCSVHKSLRLLPESWLVNMNVIHEKKPCRTVGCFQMLEFETSAEVSKCLVRNYFFLKN